MTASFLPPELVPSGLGQMLLILSGDVELNPGPQNSEYQPYIVCVSLEASAFNG